MVDCYYVMNIHINIGRIHKSIYIWRKRDKECPGRLRINDEK